MRLIKVHVNWPGWTSTIIKKKKKNRTRFNKNNTCSDLSIIFKHHLSFKKKISFTYQYRIFAYLFNGPNLTDASNCKFTLHQRGRIEFSFLLMSKSNSTNFCFQTIINSHFFCLPFFYALPKRMIRLKLKILSHLLSR